jgi:RNA polymerase sigma-70 factor, ECF subfamily
MLALATRMTGSGVALKADGDLIKEVLGGKTAAFAELASRHRQQVERLCRRFFGDEELVRDLSQESFIKAFTGLSTYRSEMPFSGWLRAIVVNVCYDELRRRRRRPEELVDFNAPEVTWLQLVNHATPEEIVAAAEERREARDLARRLLDTLKPEDRLILIMKDSEEASVAEIAQILGWSEAKVKIRAFRARHALRTQAERVMGSRKGRLEA